MKKSLLIFICGLYCFTPIFATHLRGGEITIRQLAPHSMTFRITIRVYTNTENTTVLFGGDDDILDFGDGSDPDADGKPGMLVPEQANIEMPHLGYGVAMATFTIDWTYSASGFHVVSYSEPNRNAGILNMDESVNTRFYIESAFTLDPTLTTVYQSPEALSDPIFLTSAGKAFGGTLACKDPGDFKLSYVAIAPQLGKSAPVINYRYPENFSINQYTGLISWDGNFMESATPGEFSFAVKIFQKDIDGKVLGYKIRDFQIIADGSELSIDLTDDVDLNANNKIYIGENIDSTITLYAHAIGADQLSLSATSELINELNFVFETEDSVTGQGIPVKVGRLSLQSTPDIVRTNPYNISVRVSVTKDSKVFVKDISYLFYTTVVPDEVEEEEEEEVITTNEMIAGNSIEVYPNPVSSFVRISLTDNHNPTRISILDLTGRCIDRILVTGATSYDVTGFPPGTYIITFPGNIQYKPIKLRIK
jgi:hypothetical protein